MSRAYPVGRSDRHELDGTHEVARQDGPGDLRVGPERLGHRDRTGLERELGGPVVEEPGSEEQRADGDVPATLATEGADGLAGGRWGRRSVGGHDRQLVPVA